MDQLTTVILAAGEGKRMRSRTPKVLHELCGRPLISYPLRLAQTLADRIVMVVGPNADGVRALAGEKVTTVEQRERLGTGHAVLQAKKACPASGAILVLAADMPLLRLETGIHNSDALALYRRGGFAECAPFGDYAPDPLSVFMEKRLKM